MQDIRVCTYDGPGAQPVIRTVPWPKPLPWPFTLGHELGGVIVECGSEFNEDFMSRPLKVGSKVMIPPLMPCGSCDYCIHYPLVGEA